MYLDLAVMLNFVVDLLLLMAANRLCGYPPEWKRCALGALLGGVYAGVSLLPRWHFLQNDLWRIVFFLLMACTSYGIRKGTGKRCGIFLLLSLALGGAVTAVRTNGNLGLLLGCCAIAGLCRLSSGGMGKRYLPLKICGEGKEVRITALLDTGNQLRDPITGEAVLVIGPEEAKSLLGLEPRQLSLPLDTVSQGKVSGLRLIPYRSVGKSSGILLAKRFDRVCIGSSWQTRLVAFSPEPIGNGRDYQALFGGG